MQFLISIAHSPNKNLDFSSLQTGSLHDTQHYLLSPSYNAAESSCPYYDQMAVDSHLNVYAIKSGAEKLAVFTLLLLITHDSIEATVPGPYF